MAIKKKQREIINKMLQKEDIFELVNEVLSKHGLTGLEVGSMKIIARPAQLKAAANAQVPLCENGRPAKRVITANGNIRWVCDND